jgi:hypothetical protein
MINLKSEKIIFFIKVILYVVSVFCIIITLKYFGFFKEEIEKPPVTPGDTDVVSQPSLDSGEIITDIDNMIEFLENRKNNE